MKKLTVMVLGLSMAFMLTACGDKQEKTETPEITTEQAAESTETEEKEVAAVETTSEDIASEDTEETAAEEETTEVTTVEESAQEETVGTDGDYTVCTDVDAATVNQFAANAKQAYLNGDWDTISGMIRYPITMYPDVVCNDADEFLNYMQGKKVDDSDRTEMENESCNNMFARDLGVCMGSGQIWINSDIDTNELGITAISGIVEE